MIIIALIAGLVEQLRKPPPQHEAEPQSASIVRLDCECNLQRARSIGSCLEQRLSRSPPQARRCNRPIFDMGAQRSYEPRVGTRAATLAADSSSDRRSDVPTSQLSPISSACALTPNLARHVWLQVPR